MRMKFDSLPRLMGLCTIVWGVPMALVFLVPAWRDGTLEPNLATNVVLAALVGGAVVGAALWFAIGRYLVAAKRRQSEARKSNADQHLER